MVPPSTLISPLFWKHPPSAFPSSVFMALLIFPPLPSPSCLSPWLVAESSPVLLPFSPEVVPLPVGSGDPLPPSEVLFVCCGWRLLRPGAQVYRVSWHVTLGPRCQIPEPWPGQAMPRESRSQTLMNYVWKNRPGFCSLPQAFFPPTAQCLLASICC